MVAVGVTNGELMMEAMMFPSPFVVVGGTTTNEPPVGPTMLIEGKTLLVVGDAGGLGAGVLPLAPGVAGAGLLFAPPPVLPFPPGVAGAGLLFVPPPVLPLLAPLPPLPPLLEPLLLPPPPLLGGGVGVLVGKLKLMSRELVGGAMTVTGVFLVTTTVLV